MIGIMQGRLSPMVAGKIQAFPEKYWKAEFFTAKALGFDMIEWTLDRQNIMQNPFIIDHQSILAIKDMSGVNVKSMTYDAAMQAPLVLNGKIQNTEVEVLSHVLQACKKLNVQYLIFPLVDRSSIKDDDDYREYIKLFTYIDEKLLGDKVRIAIESDFEPKRISQLITDIGSENVGINYDTGNSASLGYDFEEEMSEYSAFIFNIHLKDRKFRGSTVPLGEGDAPLIEQITYFKKYLNECNWVIQGARSRTGDDVGIAQSYLKFITSKVVQ